MDVETTSTFSKCKQVNKANVTKRTANSLKDF